MVATKATQSSAAKTESPALKATPMAWTLRARPRPPRQRLDEARRCASLSFVEHDERSDSYATNHDDGDSTYYVEHDHMGESSFQFFLIHSLVELIRFFLENERKTAFVAGNQFMHLTKGDSQANLAPDVYVIPDVQLADDEVRSWRLWEHEGQGPCLAIEIVADEADEARKDYQPQTLEKYQQMGVKELFRYDPYGVGRRLGTGRRVLLSHFVRDAAGLLQEQPLTDPWRARSTLYGFWLVHSPPRTLRLATGPDGSVPYPTRAEALALRAAEESKRAAEESKRAAEESKRATEAERLLAEARGEIQRLRAAASGEGR